MNTKTQAQTGALIAAAPELLTVLRDNMGYIPCTCPYPALKDHHVPKCESRRVREVLDKAEGRQS